MHNVYLKGYLYKEANSSLIARPKVERKWLPRIHVEGMRENVWKAPGLNTAQRAAADSALSRAAGSSPFTSERELAFSAARQPGPPRTLGQTITRMGEGMAFASAAGIGMGLPPKATTGLAFTSGLGNVIKGSSIFNNVHGR